MDTPTPLLITALPLPNGVRGLKLSGEADASNFQALAEALFSQLPEGVTRLIVDLAGLSFIDSLALRPLVQAARVLRSRHGGLTVLQPQRAVLQALQVSGASTLMLVQA